MYLLLLFNYSIDILVVHGSWALLNKGSHIIKTLPGDAIFCHVQRAPMFLAQTFRKKSFVLIFNSIIYLFIFRNKTGYHIPGCYFAYGYCYCFLELHF